MQRLLGLINVLLGAYIVWRGWALRESLAGRLRDLLQTDLLYEPTTLMAVGAITFVVGMVLLVRR